MIMVLIKISDDDYNGDNGCDDVDNADDYKDTNDYSNGKDNINSDDTRMLTILCSATTFVDPNIRNANDNDNILATLITCCNPK